MTVITEWIDGELRARRTDGKPLTDADREEVKRFAKQPGIDVETALGVFGGMVVHPDIRCRHCGSGGKIVEAVYPDGQKKLICHYCGRVADLVMRQEIFTGGEE